MTTGTLKLTALATLLASVPVLSYANLSVGDALGTAEAEIVATLEAQGAEILEVEIEDGEIEVLYRFNDELFEVEVSTETGLVLEAELEDEEDDDNDDEDDDDEDDADEDEDDTDDDDEADEDDA